MLKILMPYSFPQLPLNAELLEAIFINFQEHLNNKCESAYYESDSDDGADFGRQGSAKMPSRTPSIRSGQ